MKVSLIVATYNSEKFINKCINSILQQDYSDIEIIIIDGNSDDMTLKIIKNIFDRNTKKNKQIISEKDNGIYFALNKGVSVATGDIIGFVHSDDFLNSNTIISRVVNEFKSLNIDGVYGDINYVNAKNENKIIRNWKSCVYNSKLLYKGWMPPHTSLYLKKDVYERYGLFNTEYNISADYDFMIRILKNKNLKFKYIADEIFVSMRVGGASNNINNLIKKIKEDYFIIRRQKIGGFYTLFMKNFSKIKQFF